MNNVQFIKVGDLYINRNEIHSIQAFTPITFIKNYEQIKQLYSILGKSICDRYYKYFKKQGGEYKINPLVKGANDIFVYKINYSNDRYVYITPGQFRKLLKVTELNDIS